MSQNNKIRTATHIVTLAVIAALIILFVNIDLRDGVSKESIRTEAALTGITDITVTENETDDAPIGIRKDYRFTLQDHLGGDTGLAF